MKKKLIKYSNHFFGIGIILMLLGQFYPSETRTENYIAAGIYIISAVCFLLSLFGFIMSFKK